MFSRLFNKKNARKTPASNSRFGTGFRPRVESLEDRLVMTTLAAPIKVAIVPPPNPFVPVNVALPPVQIMIAPVNVALPPTQAPVVQAQALDLMTTPRMLISEHLSAAGDADLFSFHLNQGDFLEADVQTAANVHLSSVMKVLDASGNAIATIGASRNPTTGVMSSNPAYGFTAPADGIYQVRVESVAAASSTTTARTGVLTTTATAGDYSLELHRLALAQGTQNLATLAQKGGMYAFLKDGKLDIVGPTGYGFSISGDWRQIITPLANGRFASKYITSGGASLETSAGPIALHLAAGSLFTVTTTANTFGDHVGQVVNMSFRAAVDTQELFSPFMAGSPFGFDFTMLDQTVVISGQLGGVAGVGLGSSNRLHNTGAPINNAIPYLYFSVTPPGMPGTNLVSIMCDPADPALYIKAAAGVPLAEVSVKGIGMSQHGLIPYTPVDAPSQFNTTLGGNLVLQGSIDTTAVTMVPSKIEGDVTFNYDPNHTGLAFGGQQVTAEALAAAFTLVGPGGGAAMLGALGAADAPLGNDIGALFHNLSIGVNGTLKINPLADLQKDISWELGNKILGLPLGTSSFANHVLNYVNNHGVGNASNLELLSLGHASLIYDGPTGSFYFRGSTINPFKGTLLQSFAAPTLIDLEVAVKNGGEFFLDAKGQYSYLGMSIGGEVIIAHNFPVTGKAAQILAAPIVSDTGSSVLTTEIGGGKSTAATPTTTIETVGSTVGKTIITPPATGTTVGTLPTQLPSKVTTPTLVSGIYLDANVNILGATADLSGRMMANGDFILNGSTQAHIGALSGDASFTLSDTQAQGFQFAGHWDASFSSQYIRGDVHADLTLGIYGGHVTYAGDASASGEVKVPYIGWEGGSLSAGISNNDLWVSVGGHKVTFDL